MPRTKTAVRARIRAERRASAEAAWFYETLGGRVPAGASTEAGAAARRIEQWLRELPAFHRGAFSLRYTPRDWPVTLVEEFGDATSLVVRLECTQHPAVGQPTAQLEAASIERLTSAIAACADERRRQKGLRADDRVGRKQMQLVELGVRAEKHLASAVRALAKVRGDVPCLVPNFVDDVIEEEDECQ
jgi:hypothetical protein